MPIEATTCRQHGCKRRVLPTNPSYPYCQDHVQQKISAESFEDVDTKVEELQRHLTPPAPDTQLSSTTDLVSSLTPLDHDTATSVVDAAAIWARDPRLGIASEAQSLMPNAANDFRQLLLDQGVPSDRMRIATVTGMHRLTRKGLWLTQSDVSHRVLVIDPRTEQETVIDPVIAALAPVRNPQVPVEDQLDSGTTPFADLPWIGTASGYTDGDWLKWDRFVVEE